MTTESEEIEIKKRRKLTRVSIVDQVSEALKNDITNGVWAVGDRLPTEAELAQHFGVNRLSVRMALQKLNTLGIVETRVGEGSFICNFSLRPVFSELSSFYAGQERLKDVHQLRSLLEYECMRLAIQSATEQEKQALLGALELYDTCLARYLDDVESEPILERLVDADFNFHYQIVKMSHNQLYKDIYRMVQQLVRLHITDLVRSRCQYLIKERDNPLSGLSIHTDIYNCIVTGNESVIRALSDKMLGEL